MKTIAAFFALIFFSGNAHAQTSAEVTCRAKAKEIAIQTYSSCVTEVRNSQVQSIRSDYQKELADLKQKYDRKIQKVAPAKNNNVTIKSKAGVSSPRPVKGIAKDLPKRVDTSLQTGTVNPADEMEVSTVTVSSSDADSVIDREAQEADQLEIIDMPVE